MANKECYIEIDKLNTDLKKKFNEVYDIGDCVFVFFIIYIVAVSFITIYSQSINLVHVFTFLFFITAIAGAFVIYRLSKKIKPDIDKIYERLNDTYSKLIVPKTGKEQFREFIQYQIKYFECNSIKYNYGSALLDIFFKMGPRNLFKLNLIPLESNDIEARYTDIFAAFKAFGPYNEEIPWLENDLQSQEAKYNNKFKASLAVLIPAIGSLVKSFASKIPFIPDSDYITFLIIIVSFIIFMIGLEFYRQTFLEECNEWIKDRLRVVNDVYNKVENEYCDVME